MLGLLSLVPERAWLISRSALQGESTKVNFQSDFVEIIFSGIYVLLIAA
jgi:hypothetical protein